MDGKYFKPRRPFSFKVHKYDLGTFLASYESHLDRFFLNKLIKVSERELLSVYDYHSVYYQNKTGTREEAKKEFLEECVELLKTKLNIEKNKITYKLSHKQKRECDLRISRYNKLLMLLEKERDKWGVTNKDLETVRIRELQAEINRLKSELSNYSIKPQHKIQIMSDEKEVFINLLHQMQDLKHWEENDKDLLISHSQNTWAKILSNYFTLNGENIPLNTAKKYFGTYKSSKFETNKRYEIKVLKS